MIAIDSSGWPASNRIISALVSFDRPLDRRPDLTAGILFERTEL